MLIKQGIIEAYNYWVSYNYEHGQPLTHYLKSWLTALEGKSGEAIQIWKDGLQHAQTMEVPYEEARLHNILSRQAKNMKRKFIATRQEGCLKL